MIEAKSGLKKKGSGEKAFETRKWRRDGRLYEETGRGVVRVAKMAEGEVY